MGAGSWSLNGTTTKAAVSGTATFTDLVASSNNSVTGATIVFTSSGLPNPTVTSSGFNIPLPVLVGWQFSNPATLGTEVTYNATKNHSNLNTSVISRGAGISPTPLGRAFASNNFSVTPNTEANAISTNQFYTFSVQAKNGYKVSLSKLNVKIRRSGTTSPDNYKWAYSLNGSSFTDIVSVNMTTTGTDGDVQP